jgi:FKBP-type peptidyl-prolyl cis-trans isomerase
MKRINYVWVALALVSMATSCKNINYKKTKSGLLYKIFPAGGNDSVGKPGAVVKFNYCVKYNDSVLFDSHGKMPGFVVVQTQDRPSYDFQEIIPLMKKGDSAVVIQMIDTLMKHGSQQLPPNAKAGDRFVFAFKVSNIFPTDSLARIDYNAEREKDRPRAMKEQEEIMAQRRKQEEEIQKKKLAEWEKSGEIAKEIKAMEAYLAEKNITAQKTGLGTYVHVTDPGTGPAVTPGKYVNVKYSGRFLETDSVFEASSYAFTIGKDIVIQGWTEGLPLFKQGGKGTLYVPGFLAYGDTDRGPGTKPFTPLIFDIEVLSVSDSAPQQ